MRRVSIDKQNVVIGAVRRACPVKRLLRALAMICTQTHTYTVVDLLQHCISLWANAWGTHRLSNPNKLCGRLPQYAPALCKLTFDLESGVRVTYDVGYLCDNFSLPRSLCSRLRPYVRDREMSDRQTLDTHHRLMPPPFGVRAQQQVNLSHYKWMAPWKTEHLDIFLFSAHHSMLIYFQCSVYWWKMSVGF